MAEFYVSFISFTIPNSIPPPTRRDDYLGCKCNASDTGQRNWVSYLWYSNMCFFSANDDNKQNKGVYDTLEWILVIGSVEYTWNSLPFKVFEQ